MKPRIAARIIAKALGFFWLPCPICGQYFGGHEWKNVNGHVSDIPHREMELSKGLGWGICPECTAKGIGCYAWAVDPDWHIMLHDCEMTRKGFEDKKAYD